MVQRDTLRYIRTVPDEKKSDSKRHSSNPTKGENYPKIYLILLFIYPSLVIIILHNILDGFLVFTHFDTIFTHFTRIL